MNQSLETNAVAVNALVTNILPVPNVTTSDEIKITGFEQFALNQKISRNLQQLNFKIPTAIQQKAIPLALAGDDLIGMAQTGTGKTAAFVLPMLQKLLSARSTGSPRCLILTPTRELAQQINQVIRSFAQGSALRTLTIYGGSSMTMQLRELRRGVDVVIACPGRLLDHLRQDSIDFSHIETLILDEADQMFDMGFLPDVKRICSLVPKGRQTMLFSATMPEEIKRLASSLLLNPKTVKIGESRPADTVSHSVIGISGEKKTALLMHMLGEQTAKNVLVFTKTKHKAKALASIVTRGGYEATSLQGNLSQGQRQRALDGFKNGRFQVLVATDVAARGIDVANISRVINYDVPNTPESYTHRVGRTGRANKSGEAVTFITREDLSMLRDIERYLGQTIARQTVGDFSGEDVFAGMPSNSPSRNGSSYPGNAASNGRGGERNRRGQWQGKSNRFQAKGPGRHWDRRGSRRSSEG